MRFTDQPLEPFGEIFLDLAIPTQVSLKSALVFRMMKELSTRRCLPPDGHPQVELCFEEALSNAMLHGNRLDPNRRVRVILCADDKRWGAVVEDEGEGFDPAAVPALDDLASILSETGRGIRLMDAHLDELLYNRKGNRALLIRRREPQAEGAETAPPITPTEVPAPPATPSEPVSVERDDDVEILQINTPRLTDDAVDALRAAVRETSSARLLLDMERVRFLSSMGIGTLVHLRKVVAGREGRLVLTGLKPSVRDMLQIVKMLAVFRILPDRAAGLADLRKPEE